MDFNDFKYDSEPELASEVEEEEDDGESGNIFMQEVRKIRQKLIDDDPEYSKLKDDELRQRARSYIERRIRDLSKPGIPAKDVPKLRFYATLDFKQKEQIAASVYESIRGLGILGKIIADKSITEVMINGYNNIFVERNGRIERSEDTFKNEKELCETVMRFAESMGRPVNESEPIVDTRLKDGSRVNIVLNPIALDGAAVTIRRFPAEGMTIKKLIGYGSLTEEAARFLEKLVKARYNIFISGGTGSGKTTFLNALSHFIPSHERVITIEDSAELQIQHIPNLVRLETRNGTAGTGAITMRDLIKSSLRMRPDRVVVGEVRGAEALDMLQAMNTGHDGSISTGHANSADDMITRLETMVMQGASGISEKAIGKQIFSAVDYIIHLSRMRDGSRKTVSISEVNEYDAESNVITLKPIFEFQDEDYSSQKVRGTLQRVGTPEHIDKFRSAGILDYLD